MDRHRTDVLSLLFGLLFVAVGAAVLLGGLPGIGPWLWQAWPLLLIVAGLLVIAATTNSRRSRVGDRSQGDAHSVEDDEGDEPGVADDRAGT